MNTLILREATRFLTSLMLLFSIFMLFRGHNQPGGGFIGGLIAAAAFALYALVSGAQAVRSILRIDPRAYTMAGVAFALLAGVIAWLTGRPFLSGVWITIAGVKLGTPLLFDVGVYLVVIGAVLTIILAVKEEVE